MPSRFLRFMILASPIMLAACGDGWEMVRVDDVVPYGNTRTAGTGVAYVRAKMMPEKELKLEPAPMLTPMTTPPPAPPPPVTPVPSKAEEVFREKQEK
ncbi:MAG TPA: hypothetical protein PKX38_06405 [Alphaproteobacteria bacterium]|jgi:hypothetical protein|nr:hypothetical protein [Micavibrio sp.]HQX27551.1 hypothetical protein [Alphaproteobacteria bacterium]